MMQIQKLSESAMNCQTSDLLLNSEQNLMLPKQNCNIPTESSGETFVDNVLNPNDFDNEQERCEPFQDDRELLWVDQR